MVAGGLLGSAVLVNRAELAADVASAHEQWVVHEHLPERLEIPGFLRARRYVAPIDDAGAVRYVTLYETTDVDVLASPAYLDRLDRPTARTQRLTGASTNGRRTAARVLSSSGAGTGGVLVLGSFARPREDGTEVLATLLDEVVTPLGSWPEVLSVHLCESADEVTTVKDRTREAALAPGRSARREWLVLVEMIELAAATEVRRLMSRLATAVDAAEVYRLQVSMTALRP